MSLTPSGGSRNLIEVQCLNSRLAWSRTDTMPAPLSYSMQSAMSRPLTSFWSQAFESAVPVALGRPMAYMPIESDASTSEAPSGIGIGWSMYLGITPHSGSGA